MTGTTERPAGTRRLAAVLAADAVGFSSRMAADETGAIRAVTACLEALELVAGLHGGRVFKVMGDGLLAEFGSALAAVSAAAAMQARLAERARDLPAEASFAFRIGVHSGDVAVIGDDLLGDGVNVAARLEAAAEPGGVLISGRVHEDVAGRVDLAFEDRGALTLKGLGRPIRAFALAAGEARPAPPPAAPALPEKPSIAVLPFVNMSSDPEQAFFADGLSEDIITALASVPWLFVIARNSSFVYKGAAVDVRQVGRELGVAYVLEGSVRRAGGRLRVTGQLVDAATGAHLWAERMDGAAEDVFDLQDRVAEAVVQAIAPEVRSAEMARAGAKSPGSLTAYDRFLRALSRVSMADVPGAIEQLEGAIAAAPGRYPRAEAMRAWLHTLQVTWHGEATYERERAAGVALARRALEGAGEPADPEVDAYSGYPLAFFGDEVERGMALVLGAAERCPSFSWAWTSIGFLETMHGDESRAEAFARRSLRLNPRDPMRFRSWHVIGAARRNLGDYEGVIEAAREIMALNANVMPAYTMMIEAEMALGRTESARRRAEALTARFPAFSRRDYLHMFGRFRRIRALGALESMGERLRLAGLPE